MARPVPSLTGRTLQPKLMLVLCLLLASGVGAVFARAWAQHSTTPSPAAQAGRKEVLPSAVVTITPRGFEPSEISGVGGRFFLSVENRSDTRGLTLRLDAEHGNRVREFTQPEDELDWIDELNLPPGLYTLNVEGHPGWTCRISVTAR